MEHTGRSALIALYLERRADLVRFFTARLASAAAAEDLVQEIYVRLATADPPQDIPNPAGYLYRLGANLMLDRIRGQRRSAQRDGDWLDTQRTRMGSEDVANDPSPERAVAARQQLAGIVRRLTELSPQTQRVFRMHKFEGLSHAEIAAALGISRSGVEKHVMAALRLISDLRP